MIKKQLEEVRKHIEDACRRAGRRKRNRDLTEVGRTRPERTMSGVVRGLAESSVPVGSWLWRGNPAGMNCCGDRLHSLECASVLSS